MIISTKKGGGMNEHCIKRCVVVALNVVYGTFVLK